VSLAALLREVGSDMLDLCHAEGHHLELALPPDELLVEIDRNWIRMALTNVLNNAVRFTPSGGQITLAGRASDAAEAWITVADTGVGLAPAALEKVFDEFYQVEHHMTRRHGGLGIGLSIARGLVEAHGGRIWAASAGPGQGTTFTLALPLAGAPVKQIIWGNEEAEL
jgi:signal transduction histidine kinase